MTEPTDHREPLEQNAPTDEHPDASIDEALADAPETGAAVAVDDETPPGTRPLALRFDEANVLAARHRQTVLVLAGRIESGKTSAYAAIYERLGHGPFAGWQFAGSSTIPGFEARCHYWRETAGVDSPGMKHTQAEDLPWLHLKLAELEDEPERLELLFGDFDGEFFDQLLKGQLHAQDLPFLRRADHVGLVIDGQRIADPATRPAEEQGLRYLAEAVVGDPLWSPPSLLFVVTKLDCIEGVENEDERGRIEQSIASLHDHVSSLVEGEVPSIRLAVRSETDRFPLGHGLESLLEILALRPAQQFSSSPPEPEPRIPLSGFRA